MRIASRKGRRTIMNEPESIESIDRRITSDRNVCRTGNSGQNGSSSRNGSSGQNGAQKWAAVPASDGIAIADGFRQASCKFSRRRQSCARAASRPRASGEDGRGRTFRSAARHERVSHGHAGCAAPSAVARRKCAHRYLQCTHPCVRKRRRRRPKSTWRRLRTAWPNCRRSIAACANR